MVRYLIMEQFLKDHLKTISEFNEDWTSWQYSEDVNTDALSEDWLENRTSYIYKVGVLCAIDANKCDWVHIAIGTQRSENSEMEVKGVFYFNEGENDDMGRVIDRAFKLIQYTHPAFDVD